MDVNENVENQNPQQNSLPTRQTIPLEKRKIIKKTIGGWSFVLIIILITPAIFSTLVLSNLPDYFFVASPISKWNLLFFNFVPLTVFIIFILLLIYFYQTLYFKAYFYNLTKEHVVIKKGVIAPKEITLPYNKIQNVYVDQDVFDRFFKLYDVHFETAGFGSGLASHIDGLNEENAKKLRNIVLENMKKSGTSI